jgi:hypothetical protein
MSIFARALSLKNPAISDEVAADKAREAVSLFLADMQHKERLKREKESIEVYQIGAERQPDYDVSSREGPTTSPLEVRFIQEAPEAEQPSGVAQASVFGQPPGPIFGGGEIK